jgi:hypothetical protein
MSYMAKVVRLLILVYRALMALQARGREPDPMRGAPEAIKLFASI